MSLEDYKNLALTTFEDPEQIGCNARKEDHFLELKQLLAATNDPNRESASIKWEEVADLSAKILGNESKDLLVAAYLSIALLHTDEIPGLTVGIEVLNDLVEHYWETLYPPVRRMNGRWTAFEWFNEQLTTYLENLEGNKPKSQIDPLVEALSKLDQQLSDINEQAPTFLPLTRQFSQIIEPEDEASSDQSTVEEGQASASHSTSSSADVVASVDHVGNVDEAYDQLKIIWDNLKQLSEYLITNDEETALGYRLHRVAVWQAINQLPDHNEEGVTKIPPPDKEQIKQIDLLQSASNHQGVINSCEDWVSENPFWFDLHFAIYFAMVASGTYPQAAAVVKNELLGFYLRFPDVSQLKFANGKLMMSEETYFWLNEDLQPDDQSSKPSDGDENLTELEAQCISDLAEAKKKPTKQRLQEFAGLQHYLQSEASEKIKITFLIDLVDCLIVTKNPQMLESYVMRLEEKLDYYHLEQWDQSLASVILAKIIQAKKVLKESIDTYYQRLCMVNMKAALDCDNE